MDGAKPPRIYLHGATHEMQLLAIDPGWTLRIDELPKLLWPMNFAAQFIAHDDASAASRIRETVKEIVDGSLNPDTDATSQWVARFGDNMMKREMPEDSITVAGSTVVVQGTGASNMRKLGAGQGTPHEQN